MIQGILLGMLGLYAAEDIRKRVISVRYLPIFGAAGMILHIYMRDMSIFRIFLGAAVGIGILLISHITDGSIGMGDGLLLVVTGIFLGGTSNVELLFTGLLYAAVFSLGVLVLGKRKRRREIPFIPFLFLGYLTMLLPV